MGRDCCSFALTLVDKSPVLIGCGKPGPLIRSFFTTGNRPITAFQMQPEGSLKTKGGLPGDGRAWRLDRTVRNAFWSDTSYNKLLIVNNEAELVLSDSVSIPVIATLHDCANTGRLVLHLPGSCLAQMTADTEKSCQNEKKKSTYGVCVFAPTRSSSVVCTSWPGTRCTLHLPRGADDACFQKCRCRWVRCLSRMHCCCCCNSCR